ncbi:D-glucuronyl C5-epimerase family protein [Acetomicrobium sp.]|jgi:heparosan-N-sulfate-glucuronate 5-epimerase|uniref:D-glucuronyl C5-epimerase family protein n=1 Tax=Acetomicrobium sp. TaxID=1872099 RepID=UPI003D99F048
MRAFIEKLVTKQDYFHQPHIADMNCLDPSSSYYYDLRGRANYPGKLKNGLPVIKYADFEFVNPVGAAQNGLANLQLFWDTGDELYLTKAMNITKALVYYGKSENGSLVWRYPIDNRGHTNWLSAMAQGQAASLLLRIGCMTGEDWYHEKARETLKPFFLSINKGGVTCLIGDKYIWFEEYALPLPPYTLNGFIVALFGVRDGAIILNDKDLNHLYEEALSTLIQVLPRFNCRGWSLYDLSVKSMGPFKINNLASPFYHRFHIELLKVLELLTDDVIFRRQRLEWEKCRDRGLRIYTAIVEKVIYRMLNPVKRGTI